MTDLRSDIEGRYARLRALMAEEALDGLLAYAPGWRRENVRYLTGAPVRAAHALAYLPATGAATTFAANDADAAAVAQAGAVDDIRPLEPPALAEVLARVREDGRVGRLGIAHAELLPRTLGDALAKGLPGTELVSATKLADRARHVKSEWEVDRLRRCGEVCDEGWQRFLTAMRPGLTEYELLAEVEAAVRGAGADDNFMIVASGGDDVRGMTPPGERRLQPGDMVRTELSPQIDGYWSQICRTAVLGGASDAQRRSFELFEEATAAGLAAVRAGVTAHDVAKAENDVFRAHGYGEYCSTEYTRVRGHGHGLHLDEVPIFEGIDTVLEEGSVLIVHPNTYTPLAGYHVLGDPVVVTKDGSEPLLHTPRRLDEVAI